MPHLPNPNPVRPGPGPEQQLRELQRRFYAVSARHDRTTKLRWAMMALIAIAAILVAYPAIWLLVSSSWPITTTLRHIASAPNCEFARLVGLAPARRGSPAIGSTTIATGMEFLASHGRHGGELLRRDSRSTTARPKGSTVQSFPALATATSSTVFRWFAPFA